LATAVLIAACGASATPAPTKAPATPVPTTAPGATAAPVTPAPPPVPEKIVLHLVQGSDPDFTQVALTKAIELMNAKGVITQFNSVADTDTATRSVIAGVQDLVVNSLYFGINAVQSGIKLKTIMVDSQSVDYLLVATAAVPTIADMPGKKLGINKPGDLGATIADQCLKGAKVDVSTVNIVQVGGTSARMAAVLAGQIDAAPAHAAEALNAIKKSAGTASPVHEIANCGTTIGTFLQTGVTGTDEWLAANPVLAQMFVDSYIDALRWAATDKEGYIALSKKILPDLSDDLRGPAYDVLKTGGLFAVNGGLTKESIDKLISIGVDSKAIEGTIPTDWYTMTFIEDYLKRNGSK
jgi:ABC-type nitrate/sulfonate/bicarbonate transport system substrate-binding protein